MNDFTNRAAEILDKKNHYGTENGDYRWMVLRTLQRTWGYKPATREAEPVTYDFD